MSEKGRSFATELRCQRYVRFAPESDRILGLRSEIAHGKAYGALGDGHGVKGAVPARAGAGPLHRRNIADIAALRDCTNFGLSRPNFITDIEASSGLLRNRFQLVLIYSLTRTTSNRFCQFLLYSRQFFGRLGEFEHCLRQSFTVQFRRVHNPGSGVGVAKCIDRTAGSIEVL